MIDSISRSTIQYISDVYLEGTLLYSFWGEMPIKKKGQIVVGKVIVAESSGILFYTMEKSIYLLIN